MKIKQFFLMVQQRCSSVLTKTSSTNRNATHCHCISMRCVYSTTQDKKTFDVGRNSRETLLNQMANSFACVTTRRQYSQGSAQCCSFWQSAKLVWWTSKCMLHKRQHWQRALNCLPWNIGWNVIGDALPLGLPSWHQQHVWLQGCYATVVPPLHTSSGCV